MKSMKRKAEKVEKLSDKVQLDQIRLMGRIVDGQERLLDTFDELVETLKKLTEMLKEEKRMEADLFRIKSPGQGNEVQT